MKKGYYKARGVSTSIIFWVENEDEEEMHTPFSREDVAIRTVIEVIPDKPPFNYFKENQKDTVRKQWIKENCDHITNPEMIKRLDKKRLLMNI